MGFWPIVEQVIRNSEVVLLIMDARMPELSRNRGIEEKVARYNKPLVHVFTKIDLASEEHMRELRAKNRNAFFVSGLKNINIGELRLELKMMAKKKGYERLRIGVVGYPNVGKSALINALARRARAKVAHYAGTTRGVQWVKIGTNLKVLDSPGVIPFEDKESSLGLLGSKDPEKIKNKERVAFEIIEMFLKANEKKKLEEHFKIKSLGDDAYEIMTAIGKKRGFLKKGGEVEETKTAMSIIRDWQTGKLKI
jgi:hypothetical protein